MKKLQEKGFSPLIHVVTRNNTKTYLVQLGVFPSKDKSNGILDALEESGQADNTLVIYTADQGMFLGEHDYFDKRWIYEESFRMPFLARLPCAMSLTRSLWKTGHG